MSDRQAVPNLRAQEDTMKAADVMARAVVTVNPAARIVDAIQV